MSRLIAVAVRDDAASAARRCSKERIDADLVGWLRAFPDVGVTVAFWRKFAGRCCPTTPPQRGAELWLP
jgi:hypothetical protein